MKTRVPIFSSSCWNTERAGRRLSEDRFCPGRQDVMGMSYTLVDCLCRRKLDFNDMEIIDQMLYIIENGLSRKSDFVGHATSWGNFTPKKLRAPSEELWVMDLLEMQESRKSAGKIEVPLYADRFNGGAGEFTTVLVPPPGRPPS